MPPFTSVNDSVAVVSVAPLAARSVTVPGIVERVVVRAMFDNSPNTASTSRVPWKATSWNSYGVAGRRPRTVQAIAEPPATPVIGVLQLPRNTLDAVPHERGATASRRS
jgi:hypothetical protein